ncbi:MAG: NAD kinase [Bacteroidia bacterium]|nr:NAD kinase [Bacteroidia bacterium]
MKVFIFGQYWKKEDQAYISLLLEKLERENINYKIYEPFAQQVPDKISLSYCLSSHSELKEYAPDYIITLGGDGTILSAITLIQDLETPIMGINLGRLGFLASIEQERIETAIDKLKGGEYWISSRSMILLDAEPKMFNKKNFALNDLTILKRDNSSMIVIHTFVDDVFLNSYWADGLIVSTPTGSTGYSLSCGGPIVFPEAQNFILTPVAPHNLNVRPIMISNKHEISFKIEGRTDNFLCTLDSRHSIITDEHKVKVRRNSFETKLIVLEGDNFMKTIRNKLNWGLDKRN